MSNKQVKLDDCGNFYDPMDVHIHNIGIFGFDFFWQYNSGLPCLVIAVPFMHIKYGAIVLIGHPKICRGMKQIPFKDSKFSIATVGKEAKLVVNKEMFCLSFKKGKKTKYQLKTYNPEFRKIAEFIKNNRKALKKYAKGKICTFDLLDDITPKLFW
jgi:hypothetical protein